MTSEVLIALLVALPPTIVAVAGLVAVLQRVNQVHVLVDGKNTSLETRITQLQATLVARDVPVPESLSNGLTKPPAAPKPPRRRRLTKLPAAPKPPRRRR